MTIITESSKLKCKIRTKIKTHAMSIVNLFKSKILRTKPFLRQKYMLVIQEDPQHL